MALSDILKGPLTIYVADLDTTEPDENLSYGGTWPTGWAAIGRTGSALSVNFNAETYESESQEDLYPLAEVVTKRRLTGEVSVKEFTKDNFVLATNATAVDTAAGVGQVGYTEFTDPQSRELKEVALGFEGSYTDDSGNTFPYRILVRRCTVKFNGAMEHSKEADTELQLMFNTLTPKDGTTAAWTGHKVTAAAT